MRAGHCFKWHCRLPLHLLEWIRRPCVRGHKFLQQWLEKISHFLEVEHRLIEHACGEGSLQNLSGRSLAAEIENQIDLVRVLEKASSMWDGGWLFGGLLGHGDAFLCRDARGIRPGFVLERDSFVAAASERAALATVFNAPMDEIVELPPGEVLEIKRSGDIRREAYTPPQSPTLTREFLQDAPSRRR